LGIIYGAFELQSPAPLLQAVQSGQLPLAVVDDAVRRILRIIIAFNFQNRSAFDPSIPLDDPFSTQAGLSTAREGITLLKNEGGLLPFPRGQARSIAVVGRYAGGDPPQEGGSPSVTPIHYTSELEGLQQVAGGATRVVYLREGNLDFNVAEFRSPGTHGESLAGLKAEYFNNPDLSGSPVLRLYPTIVVPKVHLQAGQPLTVALEYKFPGTLDYAISAVTIPRSDVGLGWATLEAPADLKIYDAVVITAGFDQNYEGENADRAAVTVTDPGSFELPELQDELIQKLAAANRHTVVACTGGGSMDVQKWIGQVPGLVHAVFPGQDGGLALAEVLFGDVNPSGKLPFTFEKRFQDNPAYPNYPNDLSVDATGNTAVYREGIFTGYRGFDKNGIEPQYPFGYGLSYTTFSYSDLEIEPTKFEEDDRNADGDREKHGFLKAGFKKHDDDDHGLVRVSFTMTNTGKRAGAEIAELSGSAAWE
jgi:glycosyl hydrolase family 3